MAKRQPSRRVVTVRHVYIDRRRRRDRTWEDRVQFWIGRLTWSGLKWAGKTAALGLVGASVNWVVHSYVTDSHLGNAAVVGLLTTGAAALTVRK